MRNIRFRAKRMDNGMWLESSMLLQFEAGGETQYFMPEKGTSCHVYTDADGNIDMMENKLYRVKDETIGQFIGEKDANGRDIYEGDIVEHGDKLYWIKFFEHYARFIGTNKSVIFSVFNFRHCAVIGNIYDNPDMLEVKSNAAEAADTST